MSIQLLDKIRKINKLLHNSESGIFVFSDICKVISDVLESNALVISKSGKILGIGINQEIAKLEELIVFLITSSPLHFGHFIPIFS